MAEDPYSVLGVPRTASDEEIRKAFRKLAREHHPDLHPDDNAAAERFKQVSAAYELLGDAEKRAKFDRGEIDEQGEPRRYQQSYRRQGPFAGRAGQGSGGNFDDFGFSDIFDIFSGGRADARGASGYAARGQDARYTLEIDFLEAASGAKKRVTMPEGGVLDITVPAGVTDGQILRLKGRGSPSPRGGLPGDALIEIKVRPHKSFKRQGDDILVDVPISLDEAVLGTRIEVETISGKVQVTIPKGTSGGKVLRLRGKGVRNSTSGNTGDQLITLRIELPETIDDSLSYFMSEWRQKHGYNPRDNS
ncbi:MAG: hypothetical protein RLZ98_1892 [Pseudomonadota bacterium]|jgi:DnaJ-class molecular chaperone